MSKTSTTTKKPTIAQVTIFMIYVIFLCDILFCIWLAEEILLTTNMCCIWKYSMTYIKIMRMLGTYLIRTLYPKALVKLLKLLT